MQFTGESIWAQLLPDGTTSHSTRLPKGGNQVAGYLPNPSPRGRGALLPSPSGGRAGDEGLPSAGLFSTEVFRLKSHYVTSKGRIGRRYAPMCVFTEHGALMLSSASVGSSRPIGISADFSGPESK